MVPRKELKLYGAAMGEVSNKHLLGFVSDGGANCIGDVREYIQECWPDEQVFMLDDDMYFYHRPNMLEPKLVRCKGGSLRRMRNCVLMYLQLHPMVGLSARQGNNTYNESVKYNTRCMNAYAFDFKVLRKAGIKFGRMPIMEDFDVTLQMLRKGISNAVLFDFCWNQTGSGKKGGCSLYRDSDMQSAAARMLKRFHPDYVKLVTKESKSQWQGMETRTDVRIAWAKAAKEKIDVVVS